MARLIPVAPRYAAGARPPEYALVDDGDYARVAALRWREENGVAVVSGGRPRLTMHRFVLGAPAGQAVVHRNRDALDNRRTNLLACSTAAAISLRRAFLAEALRRDRVRWVWIGPFQRRISPERLRALTAHLRAPGQGAPPPGSWGGANPAGRGMRGAGGARRT